MFARFLGVDSDYEYLDVLDHPFVIVLNKTSSDLQIPWTPSYAEQGDMAGAALCSVLCTEGVYPAVEVVSMPAHQH